MLSLTVLFSCLATSPSPRGAPAGDDDDDVQTPPTATATATGTATPDLAVTAAPPSVPEPRPLHTIYRSEVLRATSFGPAYLLREMAPEPFRHGGRFVGWEITRLFPDDPALCAPGCGLQVGDVVLSVNGSRLETPQQLSDEFDKIPTRSALTVVSLRGEQRRTVRYAIVEDLAREP